MARNNGQHLSKSEIERLRFAFNNGFSVQRAAELIECSDRNVQKWYRFFRSGVPRSTYEPVITAYEELDAWRPHPFVPPNVLADVSHKLCWGKAPIARRVIA